MNTQSLSAAGVPVTASAVVPEVRICAGGCGNPIPAARLKARPTADKCVPCTERAGDVPKIRRYDDPIGNGEDIQEIYYKTPSSYVATAIERRDKVRFTGTEGELAVRETPVLKEADASQWGEGGEDQNVLVLEREGRLTKPVSGVQQRRAA